MNAKFGIPAVLLSTTAVGCADPLVGTWSAESFSLDGETNDIPFDYGDYMIEYIEMDFELDLTGTWVAKGEDGYYSIALEATISGVGSYTITSDDMSYLNCTMADLKLSCSAGDAAFNFNKVAAKE